MKRILILLLLIFSVTTTQAGFFGPSSSEFTPKRCAGLVLCIGGCITSGIKSYLLLGTGIALVTDSTTAATQKLQQFKQRFIDPVRTAALETIKEGEKADPSRKHNTFNKAIKKILQ